MSDTVLVPARTGNGNLRPPWRKGETGNPFGVSKERREVEQAIEANFVPRVVKLMESMFEKALAGDMQAAALYLRVCGYGFKQRDEAAIEVAAKAFVEGALAERRSRMNGGTGPTP